MAAPVPRIAIIGAGPSGLCLARLLRQSSIPSTIYERDPDPTYRRTQGSSLDLHWDTGLRAMKKAGLWDEFLKYARYEGQALVIADKHDKRYMDENGPVDSLPGGPSGHDEGSAGNQASPVPPLEQDKDQRPEIDRADLKQILLDALPEDTIRWDQKVLSISEGSNGTVNLHIPNNSPEPYDLVIGADGAWSLVIYFVSSTKEIYTGLGGFDLKIQDGRSVPALSAFVGAGSYMAVGDQKTVMAQQNGSRAIVIYAWRARDEGWETRVPYDVQDPVAVKGVLREEYEGWDENIVRLTQVADGEVLVRSLYVLPVGYRWEHRQGATLIGDAAHLMTPFAGEGVNTALADSLELAEGIVAAVQRGKWEAGALDEAVRQYEEKMFPRAEVVCQESWSNMQDFMFDSRFPEKFMSIFGPKEGAAPPSKVE